MVVPDGCVDHEVTQAIVDRWWAEVAKRDAIVGMCCCCRNPCPVDAAVCKLCAGADLDVLRRAWLPRPVDWVDPLEGATA